MRISSMAIHGAKYKPGYHNPAQLRFLITSLIMEGEIQDYFASDGTVNAKALKFAITRLKLVGNTKEDIDTAINEVAKFFSQE